MGQFHENFFFFKKKLVHTEQKSSVYMRSGEVIKYFYFGVILGLDSFLRN